MARDQEGIAAVLAIVPMLYLAWCLSWFGTFATTCTGSDPKSLGTGMILSVVFYAAGIFCLHRSDLGTVGLALALPLVLLLLRQATWAAELFVVVHINGRSACSLMMGDDYGETDGGWEYVYPFYYFIASAWSVAATVLSHWRHRRSRKPTLPLDAFD
jgi:hypothetical protein